MGEACACGGGGGGGPGRGGQMAPPTGGGPRPTGREPVLFGLLGKVRGEVGAELGCPSPGELRGADRMTYRKPPFRVRVQ